MHGISAALQSKYKTPRFPPHVTLLGSIPLDDGESTIVRIQETLKDAKPIPIDTSDVVLLEEYYRDVILKISSKELQHQHERLLKAFPKSETRPFFPHLSLTYGRRSYDEKKSIKRDVETLITGKDLSWTASTVLIVSGGQVKDWKIVGQVTLKS